MSGQVCFAARCRSQRRRRRQRTATREWPSTLPGCLLFLRSSSRVRGRLHGLPPSRSPFVFVPTICTCRRVPDWFSLARRGLVPLARSYKRLANFPATCAITNISPGPNRERWKLLWLGRSFGRRSFWWDVCSSKAMFYASSINLLISSDRRNKFSILKIEKLSDHRKE